MIIWLPCSAGKPWKTFAAQVHPLIIMALPNESGPPARQCVLLHHKNYSGNGLSNMKELKASTKFNRSYTDSLRPTAMHGVQVDEMSLQM